MFIKSSDWAYDVLEVSRNASNEDIKKKYRQMALKNHPDKVAYLGEEIRKRAGRKIRIRSTKHGRRLGMNGG